LAPSRPIEQSHPTRAHTLSRSPLPLQTPSQNMLISRGSYVHLSCDCG
jgi:hypothetical protein